MPCIWYLNNIGLRWAVCCGPCKQKGGWILRITWGLLHLAAQWISINTELVDLGNGIWKRVKRLIWPGCQPNNNTRTLTYFSKIDQSIWKLLGLSLTAKNSLFMRSFWKLKSILWNSGVRKFKWGSWNYFAPLCHTLAHRELSIMVKVLYYIGNTYLAQSGMGLCYVDRRFQWTVNSDATAV